MEQLYQRQIFLDKLVLEADEEMEDFIKKQLILAVLSDLPFEKLEKIVSLKRYDRNSQDAPLFMDPKTILLVAKITI